MGRLSDALKALFGSNKTTGTYVPLVTRNGTPDGNISIGNFASAINANITVLSTQNADPDSYTSAGAYQCTTWNSSKAPSASGVLYIPLWRDGYWRFEYFVGTAPGQLWYRRGASSSWTQWIRIYDETQDVLAPIAGSVSDLNTIVKPCTTLTDRNASNAPEANKYGYLTCLKFQSYLTQIWVDTNLTKMYIRSANASSGWSGVTWKVLATITDPS